jgi:3-oxoadipate enol-lactonase
MFVHLPNRQRLYYSEHGSGPAIVFSHGLLMDAAMWQNQVDHFSRRFRCVVWDQRGHGQTTFDGRPFDFWDSARDLIAVLDKLDIDHAVLAGHSQGGFISLRAALSAPERVSGLVLAPSHGHALDVRTREAFTSIKATWEAEGPEPIRETLLGLLVGTPDRYATISRSWDALSRTTIGSVFEALINLDDLGERPSTISASSLVIHGGADPAMSVELGRELYNSLGNAVGFHVIEGAGHAPSLTAAGKFNPLLDAFLEEYVPAG